MTSGEKKMLAVGFIFGVAWTLVVINVLELLHIPVWQ